jgi:hypothetical protein
MSAKVRYTVHRDAASSQGFVEPRKVKRIATTLCAIKEKMRRPGRNKRTGHHEILDAA